MQEMSSLFAMVMQGFLSRLPLVGKLVYLKEKTHGPQAYLVIQGTIENKENWRKYSAAVVPLIASFGGNHPTKGGSAELFEDDHADARTALLDFPSMDAIHAFWNSPGYDLVKGIRRDAAMLEI